MKSINFSTYILILILGMSVFSTSCSSKQETVLASRVTGITATLDDDLILIDVSRRHTNVRKGDRITIVRLSGADLWLPVEDLTEDEEFRSFGNSSIAIVRENYLSSPEYYFWKYIILAILIIVVIRWFFS